jgi:hypothetical protein
LIDWKNADLLADWKILAHKHWLIEKIRTGGLKHINDLQELTD